MTSFLKHLGGHTGRIVLALVFALPLVFMLVSSFKPDDQIFGDLDSLRAFLPVGALSLDNYTAVFERVPAARFLLNSVLISSITVVLGILVNSMAAFALSRMRWPGRKLVLTAIIATLIVPFETFALPLVWWVNQLPLLSVNGFHLEWSTGWMDTYQVQILPFVANAFSVFFFHQYFQSIPKELDEAAIVDGGWFTIYRRIVMPLSEQAVATVAILTFLAGLELLPVAADGRAERGTAAGDGGYLLLLPAERGMGPDHGVLLHDHRADPGALRGVPALLRQQHRLQRRQGLTLTAAPGRSPCSSS